MPEENKIKDAADAVKGVLEAVPIYQDALQPATKEIGKGLQTVAKLINVALAPIKGLVWSYEKLEDYLGERLSHKLQYVPPEQIITPPPLLAVHAMQSLMLTAGEPNLSELYANLIATSMDKATTIDAHPFFVEIIKQMSSDEAKIVGLFGKRRSFPCLKMQVLDGDGKGMIQNLIDHFTLLGEEAGCDNPERTGLYIDNLQRLGLLIVLNDSPLYYESNYEPLIKHKTIKALRKRVEDESDAVLETIKGSISVTTLGTEFYNACVVEKGQKRIDTIPSRILNFTDY